MDELQCERKDPTQNLGSGLLDSSTDVDSFQIMNNPLPITNGMCVCVIVVSCIQRMYLV